MSYILEIQIQGLPKIASNGSHGHWRKAHNERKEWKRLVALAIGYNVPEKPLNKVRCTFVRHSSVEPDFDNMVISWKPIIDSLRECGVIANDRRVNIVNPVYRWEKAKVKEGFVSIKVEEI